MKVQEIQALIREIPSMQGINIVVVGSGYVGLPLAVLKALQGANVHVVDIDATKIDRLRQGKPPFYEDGLTELLAKAIALGRIDFHTDLVPLVGKADVIFCCVGTPPNGDGSADLSAVYSIGSQIGSGVMCGQQLLVVQTSTVPPGTTREFYRLMMSNLVGIDFEECDVVVAMRPEFLTQGYAFRDNLIYARKVAAIYPVKDWAKTLLQEVDHTYEPAPYLWVGELETAEMVKYAANCLLATKISFVNEIGRWAAGLTNPADITEVAQSIGLDSRIGTWGLNAGLGYGGGCFPKDTEAAVEAMSKVGVKSAVVAATIQVNTLQPLYFVEMIRERFGGDLTGFVIACGGVTFKPDTDFVFPSQAHEVIRLLVGYGAKVQVYDPAGLNNFAKLQLAHDPNVKICEYVEDMLIGSDAYALLTEWTSLVNVPISVLNRMNKYMNSRLIFDGRNAMDPQLLKHEGFEYVGFGR